MAAEGSRTCRVCGKSYSLWDGALELKGYCGRCAEELRQQGPILGILPSADVRHIAGATLQKDLSRFALVALISGICCFIGAVIGGIVGAGRETNLVSSSNAQTASLQASWLFGLVGLYLGRVSILRASGPLSLARWRVFWFWFLGAYFASYIPLAILCPKYAGATVSKLMTRMDAPDLLGNVVLTGLAFFPSVLIAYAGGAWATARSDRDTKATVCSQCRLPDAALEHARNGDWSAAVEVLRLWQQESTGLLDAAQTTRRLRLQISLERRSGGAPADAAECLEEALRGDPAFVSAKYHLAILYAEMGKVSAACDLLEEYASEVGGPAAAKSARRLAGKMEKKNRLRIRCPHCGRVLRGTIDMIGSSEECPKCGREFELDQKLKL